MGTGPDTRPPQDQRDEWPEGGCPLVLPLPGNEHDAGASRRPGALQNRGCQPREQVCLASVPWEALWKGGAPRCCLGTRIMSSVSWHHQGGCQKHPHTPTVTAPWTIGRARLAGRLWAAHCHSLSLSFLFLPALVLGILWPPARGEGLASTPLAAAETGMASEKEGGALPLAVRTLGSGH